MSWDFDYSAVNSISNLLEENGLNMTKKFGQNFLVNKAALEKIVNLSGAARGRKVWEVGPGIGALTSLLLKTGAQLTAFEIDHGFCRILREKAFTEELENGQMKLIEGDALKTWLSEFEQNGAPDVICANLPYNVGSVLIGSFIEHRCLPPLMVYTLQSEVVHRICAKPSDEDYSGFSVVTSLDYENREAFVLKAGNFWPAPNVDSSVVEMRRKAQTLIEEDGEQAFFDTVHALFAQRRKTVKNNLKALKLGSQAIDSALESTGISPAERAENLSVEQIARLSKALR